MSDGADVDVRALAEAVADVLEERGLVPAVTPGIVLTVADVARLLGRRRQWVYEHAAELGAFRFGCGPKARLGLDRNAIESWKRKQQIRRPPATARPPRCSDSSDRHDRRGAAQGARGMGG